MRSDQHHGQKFLKPSAANGRGAKSGSGISGHLLVADLRKISLKELVQKKLDVFFDQEKPAQVGITGLYKAICQEVSAPLIERSLIECEGSQVRAAKLLGLNRSTLKKKITLCKITMQKKPKSER